MSCITNTNDDTSDVDNKTILNPSDQIHNTSTDEVNKTSRKFSIGTQTDTAEEPDKESHILYQSPKTPPMHLWKSIKLNWIFYTTLIGCCCYISQYTQYSFTQVLISIIIMSLLGYFVHMIGHYIEFTRIYSQNNNYITQNTVLNTLTMGICQFLDFHDVIHHNTSINKQPLNVIYEFINNFVLQGGLVVFLMWAVKYLSSPAILLWSLLYATVHNVNYILMPPKTHQNHHTNKHSSYGLDIWDILFNTKTDPNELEVYNHMSINMIILTLGLTYYYTKNVK